MQGIFSVWLAESAGVWVSGGTQRMIAGTMRGAEVSDAVVP